MVMMCLDRLQEGELMHWSWFSEVVLQSIFLGICPRVMLVLGYVFTSNLDWCFLKLLLELSHNRLECMHLLLINYISFASFVSE